MDINDYWSLTEEKRKEVDKLREELKKGFATLIVLTIFFAFFFVLYLGINDWSLKKSFSISGEIIQNDIEELRVDHSVPFYGSETEKKKQELKNSIFFGLMASIIIVSFLVVYFSRRVDKYRRKEVLFR